MNYLKVPDSNIKLTDGSIVMLARFPGTKWVVHYGWYDYAGRRAMGWYFCSIPAQTVIPVSAQDLQLIVVVDPTKDNSIPDPPIPPGPPPPGPPGPFPFPPGPGPSGECGPGPFIPESGCFPGPISPIVPSPLPPGPGEDSGVVPANPFLPFTRNDKFMLDASLISLPSMKYRDCLNTICKIPDGKIVRVNNVDGKVRYYSWNDADQRWDEVYIEVDVETLLEDYYTKVETDQKLQELSTDLQSQIDAVDESLDNLVSQFNDFKDQVDATTDGLQDEIDSIKSRLSSLEDAVFRIEKIVIDSTNTVLVSQDGTLKDSGVSIGDDTIGEPSQYADDKVLATEKAVTKKVEDSVTKWSSF